MRRKWYGRDFMKSGWKSWRPLFSVWCLLDLVISPVLFALCWLICYHRERKIEDEKRSGKTGKGICEQENGCGLEYTSMKTSVPNETFQPLKGEFLFIESVYYLSMQATVSFMETINNKS